MSPHWLSKDRLIIYPAAFLVIYLSMVLFLLARFPAGVDERGHTLTPDFVVFWGASHLALSGDPQGAYDPVTVAAAERLTIRHLSATGDWIYPPTFYLMMVPLALLPFFWSYVAFMASTFLAYLWVVRRAAATTLALLPVLGFPGACLNFVQGQNGFLTAALCGGALLLLPRRPIWAGVLIGLLIIKPQLGLLLPLALVCGRHWHALFAAAVTALMFLTVSVLALGPETMQAFFGHLGGFSAWAASNRNLLLSVPTFFSFFRLLGLAASPALLIHGALALAIAIATGWIWRVCPNVALRSAALVVATLMVSPYLLDYDLVWLALAIAWFASYAVRHGWRSGEREMLVLAWLLPLCMTLIHRLLQVQLAPFILLGLFLMMLRRVREDRMRDGAGQDVRPVDRNAYSSISP